MNSIDGGNGTDIAVYLRQLASYQFIRLGDGAIQVADVDSGETDTARNVELFVFTDAIRAVDDLPFAATLTANDQGGVDIDLSNAAALSESLGTAGVDNVTYGGTDDIDLPDNVENVTLTGIADISVTGNDGDNTLIGNAGNNTLVAGDGDDLVDGGDGDDTLVGGSGAGDDTYIGGVGIDTVIYSSATQGITVDLAAGTASGPEIGNDTLISIENVVGGSGNDIIHGDAGDNQLFGGDGDDLLTGGGGGTDLFDGGNGLDRVSFSAATGAVNVQLAAGTAVVNGNNKTFASIELIRGTQFNDAYDATGFSGASANAGSNGTFNEFEGLGGDDTVIGNGDTRVSYFNAVAGVNVNLGTGTAVSLLAGDVAGIGTDSLTSVNAARGSEFDDELRGGAGNDTLLGGAGNDFLGGAAGDDILNGGAGIDTAAYGLAGAAVTVDLAAGTATGGGGNDTLTGIEVVNGSAFNDVLRGDGGDNTLNGNDGNDFLIGRGGNDTLNGGNGIDIAALPGDRSEYTFGIQGTAQFVSGPGGFDLTTSVELLQFNGADTVADAYQLGYGMTPINLTGFGLAGGLPIFGRGVADLLTMGTNANFRLIDLGVGVDTLTLGTANASYFLNLANVENLVGSSGNDTIGMTTSVGTSNMLVDGGFGNDTLSLSGGNNVVSVTNVETVTAFGGANTVFFVHNDGSVGQSFNLGGTSDGLDRLYLQGSNSNYSLSSIVGDMTVIGDSLSDNETVSVFNIVASATFDLGSGNEPLTLNSNSTIGPASNVVFVRDVETVTAVGDKSDFIHILGGATTVTAGGGPDMIWAGPDADHFRFMGTGDSPDIPLSQGQKDVIDGFNAAEDRFVFDGIAGTALTWELTTWSGADLVRVDFDGNAVGDFGWDMAIQVNNLTGTLTNANFEWVI